MANQNIPISDELPIALRAYVTKNEPITTISPPMQKRPARKKLEPSQWTLIFDTETTIDASQKLRFGTYQVRKGDIKTHKGIFYDDTVLSEDEINTLKECALAHNLNILTVQEFIKKIFFGVGYKYRARIVGFNLPFDISRLAIDHAEARTTKHNKLMQGGFTFKLIDNDFYPRVQIKHMSARNSFIQFTSPKGQRTSKSNRKKKRYQPPRRGFFIDVKTLAAALTSQSHTLDSLAKSLRVDALKKLTDDHGKTLTIDYIEYAVGDTETTWQCYKKLQKLYDLHGLELTHSHNIHSEASLGKAYLRDMGIQPWQKMQSDFPNDLTGIIISTYFGGRSEVHIRKKSTQILYCDFLSMYPTVCTLMGLWQFVTAQGMNWHDSTKEIKAFFDNFKISDLQNPDTWKSLTTLVKIKPDSDVFPVRAKYGGDAQYTIGLNYLTSDENLWFTLADCISSQILIGKTPKIIEAISFTPSVPQDNLKPVCIAGNQDYTLNPYEGDFFRRVIDLRSTVKDKIKTATPYEKDSFENQQLALKILANATSYGIFVELNVEEEKQKQKLICHGYNGIPTPLEKNKFEKAGTFFHPLLATLITGAARLMLATTERLTVDAGLDWAFCDTDSMAIAKPDDMTQDDFYKRAISVQEWFTPLNPYSKNKSPLLKIEDYNYSPDDRSKLQPLYCHAVSSKRYALYNLDENNKPVLKKVSSHGLGHLIAPYQNPNIQNLEDAQPWQQDLWFEIITSSLENRHPDYQSLKGFNTPAVSRYGATKPILERWFNIYNADKDYNDRVRPFNFLLCMQSETHLKTVKPVAPFSKDLSQAVKQCFDRDTGDKVNKSNLKTYVDAVAQYHLHPETKFLNGDYIDIGTTQRRHIKVASIQNIGKEANKWEEQFFTGFDKDAQIEYGIDAKQKIKMTKDILVAIKLYGAKQIAVNSKISERHILNISKNKKDISEKTLLKLYNASKHIENSTLDIKNKLNIIIKIIKKNNISNIQLAKLINIDPSNLSKILNGKRLDIKRVEYIFACLTAINLHD